MTEEYYKSLSRWWEQQWDRTNYIFYALAICLLLIVAFYVVAYTEPEEKFSHISRDLVLGLIVHTVPTLVIIVISFLFFSAIYEKKAEKERVELLADIEKRFELATQSDAEVKRMLRESGLLGVYERHHRERILNSISQCSRSVGILHTYLIEPAAFEDPLIEAAKRGASIRVLLLDPDSPVAKQRSIDLWPGDDPDDADQNFVPSQIRLTIGELRKIAKSNKLEDFEVRLYDNLLSAQIYSCDDELYLGFYPKGKNSIEAAQLQIHGDTFLSRQFVHEFNTVWQNASPVT